MIRSFKKLCINVDEIFGRVIGLETRNNQLDFSGDLHSFVDPGILLIFLLCLLVVCKMVLLYYCLLVVSSIMPIVLVTSMIFCTSLTL